MNKTLLYTLITVVFNVACISLTARLDSPAACLICFVGVFIAGIFLCRSPEHSQNIIGRGMLFGSLASVILAVGLLCFIKQC